MDVCRKAEIITGDSQIQFSVTSMVKTVLSVKLMNRLEWHMARGVLKGQHGRPSDNDPRQTIHDRPCFFLSWKLIPRSIMT